MTFGEIIIVAVTMLVAVAVLSMIAGTAVVVFRDPALRLALHHTADRTDQTPQFHLRCAECTEPCEYRQ